VDRSGRGTPGTDGPGEALEGTARDDGRSDEARDPVRDTVNRAEHGPAGLAFDRHLVLEQLGGWRGMVDASLPTVAFILANAANGLRTGVWAALGSAFVVFVLRLVRRESVQQAVSGLFAVGIAVAIAAASGQARDFFVFGIVRNAVIGVVLIGSIAVRRPLVGVIAEFLAPSHLGTMASHSLAPHSLASHSLALRSLPGLRSRPDPAHTSLDREVPVDPAVDPATGRREADPAPERPWREDPRLMRAYSWLTVLWGVAFLLRVAVQALLYQANAVGLLGTASLVLGLPLTAVDIVVTLWVVGRLHRHRRPPVTDAAHAPVVEDVRSDPAA
jgi:hypothetical protein